MDLTWLGDCDEHIARERASAAVSLKCGLIKPTLWHCPDVDDFLLQTTKWVAAVGTDDKARLGGVLLISAQAYACECIQTVTTIATEAPVQETPVGLHAYFFQCKLVLVCV